MKNNVYTLSINAFLTAFICVCSLFTFYLPINAVPITMQTLAIFFIILSCGKKAFIPVSCYILLGLFGIPVFSGFKSGVGVLLGPTGGFIIGFFVSSLVPVFYNKINKYIKLAITILIIYFFGVAWYVALTGSNIIGSVVLLVLPYVIPDILKAGIAIVLFTAVKKTGMLRLLNQ